MIILEIKNLTVSLKSSDRIILDDVELFIKEGDMVGLVGLSGAGKSVLAKTIAGIIPRFIPLDVTAGSIDLYGEDVRELTDTQRLETVGYIFQNADNQVVSDTVEKELSFGPENLALDEDEIEIRVSKVLNDLNMKRYRHYNPDALSGGEKYLLALGAILTIDPKILICDEILCQLDDDGVSRVIKILQKLQKEGKTIIIIEHDMKKLDFVDHIYYLNEGKLSSNGKSPVPTNDIGLDNINGDGKNQMDIDKVLGKKDGEPKAEPKAEVKEEPKATEYKEEKVDKNDKILGKS